MRVVYIAHRLNAPTVNEMAFNRRNASLWMAWAAAQGVAPVADWIVLSSMWEESPENRDRGLAIDCALIERCDEIWLCGGVISSGMRIERDHAAALGKTIRDLTYLGPLPPELR